MAMHDQSNCLPNDMRRTLIQSSRAGSSEDGGIMFDVEPHLNVLKKVVASHTLVLLFLGQVSDTFASSCIFEANLLAFCRARLRASSSVFAMKSFRPDFRGFGFRSSAGDEKRESGQTFQSLLDYLGRWESSSRIHSSVACPGT